MRLDNPPLVRWEYASGNASRRTGLFRGLIDGQPEDAPGGRREAAGARSSVASAISRAVRQEVGADGVTTSMRMVEPPGRAASTRRSRTGATAVHGRREFDCVFAGWVLYHVPNLGQAIAECSRVLRPGGRLVASSYFEDNMSELWQLIEGIAPRDPLSFNHANGAELLRRHFSSVEQRDVSATLTFPDSETMRTFVAATIDRAHLAPKVPEIEGPFRATTRHVVFVAERAG
jgi:SAM-dependent methyltransferase